MVDRDVATRSAFGQGVLAAMSSRGTFAGWAVESDDIDHDARRLGLDIEAGERTRPDGTSLRWRLAGVARAMATGGLPFFIQWDGAPDAHPARAAADHACDATGFAWIEVAGRGPELESWLGDHDLPVRNVDGPPGITAVGIATSAGELALSAVAP